MDKKLIKVLLAIVLIIAGMVCLMYSTNFDYTRCSTETKMEYGGDAYTGIQQAGAQAASNVYYLASDILSFFQFSLAFVGVSLIISGVFIILFAYSKDNVNKNKIEEKVNNSENSEIPKI